MTVEVVSLRDKFSRIDELLEPEDRGRVERFSRETW